MSAASSGPSFQQVIISGVFHGTMYAWVEGRKLLPMFGYQGTGVTLCRLDETGTGQARDLAVRLGLTAVVVLFAVGLVLYIVMGREKVSADDARAVQISSAALIKKPDSTEPKAVLAIYEDFQCPACASFEQQYGASEGDLNHGQLILDQMFFMRPLPGWSNHKTPIEGLYLCGSGAHPGGWRVFATIARRLAGESCEDCSGRRV